MAEFAKKGDLSQDALGVHKIVECFCDLFYGDLLPVLSVEGGYHHAVRAEPYRLDQLVLRINLSDIIHTYRTKLRPKDNHVERQHIILYILHGLYNYTHNSPQHTVRDMI